MSLVWYAPDILFRPSRLYNNTSSRTQGFACSYFSTTRLYGALTLHLKPRDVWYGIMKVYKETGKWLNDGQELTSYLEAEKEGEGYRRELRRDCVLRKMGYGEVFPAAMLVVKMMRNGTGTPPSGLMNRRSSTRTRSNGTMMMRDGGPEASKRSSLQPREEW